MELLNELPESFDNFISDLDALGLTKTNHFRICHNPIPERRAKSYKEKERGHA